MQEILIAMMVFSSFESSEAGLKQAEISFLRGKLALPYVGRFPLSTQQQLPL